MRFIPSLSAVVAGLLLFAGSCSAATQPGKWLGGEAKWHQSYHGVNLLKQNPVDYSFDWYYAEPEVKVVFILDSLNEFSNQFEDNWMGDMVKYLREYCLMDLVRKEFNQALPGHIGLLKRDYPRVVVYERFGDHPWIIDPAKHAIFKHKYGEPPELAKFILRRLKANGHELVEDHHGHMVFKKLRALEPGEKNVNHPNQDSYWGEDDDEKVHYFKSNEEYQAMIKDPKLLQEHLDSNPGQAEALQKMAEKMFLAHHEANLAEGEEIKEEM